MSLETVIVTALAVFVLGASIVIAAVFAFRNPSANLDLEVAKKFQEFSREHIANLEKAYQQNEDAQRYAFDRVVDVLELVAPLTPIQSDDAALEVLHDIQEEGEPQ